VPEAATQAQADTSGSLHGALQDALARVIRASEALLDGDLALAAQILDDLVLDLSRTLAFPGRP
jgi:hypothetical protein